MSGFEERKAQLWEIRNRFLKLHKLLLDWDRELYERKHGVVSSAKFLEMLMGDERFNWLRTISTLIVRIDEAFELDDGLPVDMLDGFYEESRNLFDDSDEYTEFKNRLADAVGQLPEAKAFVAEITELSKQ